MVIVPQGRAKVGDVIRLFEGGSKIWDTWTGQMVNQTLDAVGMPRFKMEYGVQSLKGELQGMGVRAAFVSNKEKPPFWELSEDPETYMDDVLHKATIECTEKGTVASAATAVVLMTRSMPRKNPEVWMDRPFVFAVRNRNSGALLFLARVDDPMSP